MKLGSRHVQIGKVLIIAALGAAGFCGVAACASSGQGSGQPRPPSAATADSSGAARDVARIAAGNGGLAALDNGDGRATAAYCDPGTVPGRPHVGGPVSAACGISYSDGSVWRQIVTVTFDSHGSPVADWANLGAELVSPAGG